MASSGTDVLNIQRAMVNDVMCMHVVGLMANKMYEADPDGYLECTLVFCEEEVSPPWLVTSMGSSSSFLVGGQEMGRQSGSWKKRNWPLLSLGGGGGGGGQMWVAALDVIVLLPLLG